MGFFQNLFGKRIPEQPYEPVDIEREQLGAIEQNRAALGPATGLASDVNRFNEAELARQFGVSVDFLRSLNRSVTESFGSRLRGEIPEDELDFIQRAGVARGFNQGLGGSPASRSWAWADLGRRSSDEFFRTLPAFERWMAMNRAGMFDPASMFVTVEQRMRNAETERNLRAQIRYMNDVNRVAPDPALRGIHDSIMSLAASALGGNYSDYYSATKNAGRAGVGTGPGGGGGDDGSDFYGPADEGIYGQPADYEEAAYGGGGGGSGMAFGAGGLGGRFMGGGG